jgi:hypothetical protein
MFCIEMMRNSWFAPTVDLENVDPRCGDWTTSWAWPPAGGRVRHDVTLRQQRQRRSYSAAGAERCSPDPFGAGHFSDLGAVIDTSQFLALAGSLAARLLTDRRR